MAPFRFPVCPACKKKNTIDLAQLQSTEIGYKDYKTADTKKRQYFTTCQHCNSPFKFSIAEGESNETRKS